MTLNTVEYVASTETTTLNPLAPLTPGTGTHGRPSGRGTRSECAVKPALRILIAPTVPLSIWRRCLQTSANGLRP